MILHNNNPWVCVSKVCLIGGTTYIFGELITKDNLNIANLMQTLEIFLSENTEQNS